MGRTRKGRPVSGWVIVNKPAGITSTSVVNKIKWAFQAQKAGHAGTLDPDATGLLAVALGEATKTVAFVTDATKAYRFMVRFGSATTTDDASGEAIAHSDLRPSDGEIEAMLPRFTGNIEQVPPLFSAIKVDGERAYDLAREGEVFELQSRPLFVESLRLIERPDADHALLEMVCGKGGYVRSIARDLGEALGGKAHVLWLHRIWSSGFDLEGATTMEEIESLARSEEIDRLLRPITLGVKDMPKVLCSEEAAVRLKNGNAAPILPQGPLEFGQEAWVEHNGQILAIGQYRGGELHPSRVFNL